MKITDSVTPIEVVLLVDSLNRYPRLTIRNVNQIISGAPVNSRARIVCVDGMKLEPQVLNMVNEGVSESQTCPHVQIPIDMTLSSLLPLKAKDLIEHILSEIVSPVTLFVRSGTLLSPQTSLLLDEIFTADQNLLALFPLVFGATNSTGDEIGIQQGDFPAGFSFNELAIETFFKGGELLAVTTNPCSVAFALRTDIARDIVKSRMPDYITFEHFLKELVFTARSQNLHCSVSEKWAAYHQKPQEKNDSPDWHRDHKLFISRHEPSSTAQDKTGTDGNTQLSNTLSLFRKPNLWKIVEKSKESPWTNRRETTEMGKQTDMASTHSSTGHPRIIYILPRIDTYGGVISVIQLVTQLNTLGFSANIATYGTVNAEIFERSPSCFRPYVFPNVESMIDEFPKADIVVATHWTTVYPATLLGALRPDLKLVYFVQDYEPDFCHDETQLKQAERSYRLIKKQIVKTQWLRNKILPFGGEPSIIPLGLNLDYFHPGLAQKKQRIITTTRKSSKHRNYPTVIKLFEEIYRQRPQLELAIYGNYDECDFSCPIVSLNKFADLTNVAAAISESLVLFDCSTFQGFGRPGIEAMACGTSSVLTREGGITQYAKHGYNTLLADPTNVDDFLSKIFELIDAQDERERLVINGLKTAADYSHYLEGERTAQYMRNILS